MNVPELKAGLATLAEPVVPAAEPYGRLLRRARRARRVRVAGWSSAVAATIAAALLAPLLVQASTGGPSPTPSAGVDDLRGADITGWVQRLLDTPARGSLAADAAFTSTLTGRLAPRLFGFSPELSQQTILFAGDVGTYRTVLIAFHSDTRQMGVWLVGDEGASAAQLASAAARSPGRASATPTAADRQTKILPEELQPFTATAVTDAATNRYLTVGVAPGGCQLATKDATHPQTWHDEATADYVVRTDPLAAQMSTLVRATCDGVVRYQAPITNNARVEITPLSPTEHQIDAALAGARGTTTPDRAQVRTSLIRMMESAASADSCKVLYSGQIPGSVDSSPVPGGALREPPVLLTACTTTHGNTMFEVTADDGAGNGGYSRVKLTDPHAIIAVRGVLEQDTTTQLPNGTTAHGESSTADERTLILAPAAATQLQVVKPGQVTQQVPLDGGVGSIVIPNGETVQLRALDRSGAVVGTNVGPIGGEDLPEEHPADATDTLIDNWS